MSLKAETLLETSLEEKEETCKYGENEEMS